MVFKKKSSTVGSQVISTEVRLPSQAYIIAEVIRGCKYENYLELGIYHGDTFNYIKQFTKRAVGVDMEHKDFIPKGDFFCMTTDEFFDRNKAKFDVIFIDAAHEYEQVKKDFDNSIEILNKGGVIFLHDTDPFSKEYMGPTFCNDAYKMNIYLEKQDDKYNYITIPMDETGLTLVKIRNDNRFERFLG